MNIKIEELKKSERGIEVTGYVPTPDRDGVIQPNIPYGLANEDRERLLASYYSNLKAANKEYDAETREFERLHLGEAALIQEKAKGEVKENDKSID